ncbi:hypothetical protein [Roseivirga pacifica]|uniref:hypothetical protein n=1 Tax=Roseivirga pacifica TaxID=1267423 RepID=UPI003BAA4C49
MDIFLDLDKLDNYTPPPQPAIINGSSFNDRAKSFTTGLLGAIPKAGSGLKFLVGLFWPSSKDDLWKKIEANVERAIDAKLTTYNIDKAFGLLEMIQEDITKTFDNRKEKISPVNLNRYSVTIESNFSSLRKQYFSKTYGEHLLNLMIVAAHLELSYLRVVIDLFDDDKEVVDKYTEIIRKTHEEYISLFSVNFKKWRSFRNSQFTASIKEHQYRTPRDGWKKYYEGSVNDKLPDTSKNSLMLMIAGAYTSNNKKYVESAQKRYRECLYNQSVGYLLEGISSAAILNRYIPRQENAAPVFPTDFQHRYLGPYFPSAITEWLKDEVGPVTNDKPGRIPRIELYANKQLKLFYQDKVSDWQKDINLTNKEISGTRSKTFRIPDGDPISLAKIRISVREYYTEHFELLKKSEAAPINKSYINATLGDAYEISSVMVEEHGLQTTMKYFHTIKFRFDYSLGFMK